MTSYTRFPVSGVLACLIVGAVISGVAAKPPHKVVGGYDASPGTFRFVVGIGFRWSPFQRCGGSIITPRHILTAAHCVDDVAPGEYVIRSGANDLRDDNMTISDVKNHFIHPEYRPYIAGRQGVANDIAIILLEKDLKIGAVSIIGLPTAQPDYSQSYHAVGWGRVFKELRNQQYTLQVVHGIALLDDVTCWLNKGIPDQPSTLCGYNPDATICNGDSGSPLVAGGRIVGIASTSVCERAVAHSYTNVYHYRDWINATVTENFF